jgi:bile acid-coenzyme A ligase
MVKPIGRILTELAQENPKAPAVTCGADRVTRDELERRANRMARQYAALGVDVGDFVTIGLPNSVEFVVSAFAAWKIGAVPQPVSPKLPGRERHEIVALANPKIVVGVPRDEYPGRVCLPAGFEADGSLSDEPLVPDRISPHWKAPTSGGSTGRPKIIVSNFSGEVNPESATSMGVKRDGAVLVPGPLYHNAPFATTFTSLLYGAHVVLLGKFDEIEVMDSIDRYRVGVTFLVPTMMLRMWRALEREPERWKLDSLDAMWHGAAPCPGWLKEAWIERLGPEHVFELYGGTEQQAMTTISGTEWLEHRGSVGRPSFGEVRVLDEDGKELPAGEVGEIFMRGDEGKPPTYQYIGAEARVVDGWESLGDLGWLDEAGYLYLSDRRTDMILSGGANIYPAEVEVALMEHPAVECAVVVGLPDDDLGQRVHAVVQAVAPVDAEHLISFLSDQLVRYKIPRSLRVVHHALRDDAGKVRRAAVRDEEVQLMQAAGQAGEQ